VPRPRSAVFKTQTKGKSRQKGCQSKRRVGQTCNPIHGPAIGTKLQSRCKSTHKRWESWKNSEQRCTQDAMTAARSGVDGPTALQPREASEDARKQECFRKKTYLRRRTVMSLSERGLCLGNEKKKRKNAFSRNVRARSQCAGQQAGAIEAREGDCYIERKIAKRPGTGPKYPVSLEN